MTDPQSTPESPDDGAAHEPQPPPDAGLPPAPDPMTRERAIELLKTDVKAWNEWREGKKKEELPDLSQANLNGLHLEGADLRYARLEEAELIYAHLEEAKLQGARLGAAKLKQAILHNAHLEGADLRVAGLERAELKEAHLEKAILLGANLKGANLQSAHLEGAMLVGARLDGAGLLDAHLEGANLRLVHLEGAKLPGAHLEGADLRAADFSNANVDGVKYDRKRGKFRGIRVDTCYGHALFVRDAQDQDYIETYRAQHPIRGWLWHHLTDSGRSLLRVAALAFVVAMIFGFVFQKSDGMLYYEPEKIDYTWYTPYYYSIVTYTTLGFGDVSPKTTAGQIIVTAEVILGYVTLGLLVSILANKVARRA